MGDFDFLSTALESGESLAFAGEEFRALGDRLGERRPEEGVKDFLPCHEKFPLWKSPGPAGKLPHLTNRTPGKG